MRRRSEKYVTKGSKYASWIGLYLSFHLNWVLGPFVYGKIQNLQTSEATFVHVITPLNSNWTVYKNQHQVPLIGIELSPVFPGYPNMAFFLYAQVKPEQIVSTARMSLVGTGHLPRAGLYSITANKSKKDERMMAQ